MRLCEAGNGGCSREYRHFGDCIDWKGKVIPDQVARAPGEPDWVVTSSAHGEVGRDSTPELAIWQALEIELEDTDRDQVAAVAQTLNKNGTATGIHGETLTLVRTVPSPPAPVVPTPEPMWTVLSSVHGEVARQGSPESAALRALENRIDLGREVEPTDEEIHDFNTLYKRMLTRRPVTVGSEVLTLVDPEPAAPSSPHSAALTSSSSEERPASKVSASESWFRVEGAHGRADVSLSGFEAGGHGSAVVQAVRALKVGEHYRGRGLTVTRIRRPLDGVRAPKAPASVKAPAKTKAATRAAVRGKEFTLAELLPAGLRLVEVPRGGGIAFAAVANDERLNTQEVEGVKCWKWWSSEERGLEWVRTRWAARRAKGVGRGT